jgi:hypothetical protein
MASRDLLHAAGEQAAIRAEVSIFFLLACCTQEVGFHRLVLVSQPIGVAWADVAHYDPGTLPADTFGINVNFGSGFTRLAEVDGATTPF